MFDDFVVGIPRCNTTDLLVETLESIAASSRKPVYTILVDNGDEPWIPPSSLGSFSNRSYWLHGDHRVDIVRPMTNLGCAGGWNLIHTLAKPWPIILLNDDCVVAPDTFERMLAVPEGVLVEARGFCCFRIDEKVWNAVGPFDEEFYPAYWEDADYRYRCDLAEIKREVWDSFPLTSISPGRERDPHGIVHGKHDSGGYQGWRNEKLAWFKDRFEQNKQRYLEKWGPLHAETFTTPFNR